MNEPRQLQVIYAGIVAGSARPGFNKATGHVFMQDKSRRERAFLRQAIADAAEKAGWQCVPASTPDHAEQAVEMSCLVLQPMPAGWPKKKRLLLDRAPCSRAHSDVDNIIKHLMDASSGIIYQDDRQVWRVLVTRQWDSGTGRMVIRYERSTSAGAREGRNPDA